MNEAVRRVLKRRMPLMLAGPALVLVLVVRLWNDSAAAPALLITLTPAEIADVQPGSDPGGNAVARLEIGTPERPPQILFSGFAAALTPRVSYDGRRAIFAGRRAAGDPLQIWEVALTGSSPRLIVGRGDCLDPAYLPDGRIAYARSLPGAGLDAPLALYTAQADGQDEYRITFGDARDRAPAVLPDGRIVFRRHPRLGGGPGRLFAVNPDGTGLQPFCDPIEGASIDGGPWVIDGRVIFAEGAGPGPSRQASRLVSVSARQPLAGRDILAPGGEGPAPSGDEWFSSVSKLPDGGLVASAFVRQSGWVLRRLTAQNMVTLPRLENGLRPAGVAFAAPHARPLSLTSVVDRRKSTGTVLCLDARNSRVPAVANAAAGTIQSVRVLTMDGRPLGESPVERDGSFFLEIPADQPLRLELRGAEGVLAEDRSGFWVRPNENRGCIGCHEDPEIAPENRVPVALDRGQGPARALAQVARSDSHSQ